MEGASAKGVEGEAAETTTGEREPPGTPATPSEDSSEILFFRRPFASWRSSPLLQHPLGGPSDDRCRSVETRVVGFDARYFWDAALKVGRGPSGPA